MSTPGSRPAAFDAEESETPDTRIQPGRLFDLALVVFAALIGAAYLSADVADGAASHPSAASPDPTAAHLNEPIRPVAAPADLDPRKVDLGARLFAEPRLSADDTIACASCHRLDRGGVDRLPRSPGVGGQTGVINTPSVFNSALQFRQFWDGRAADLSEQVAGPIHNPIEMASDWEQVTAKLRADPEYVRRFETIYPEGINPETITDAIVTFERALATPDAPFDRYLRGDENAIGAAARNGYRLFRAKGCIACHQGVAVGGNLYSRFGVMGDYFGDRGGLTQADNGRYNVTGNEEHRHMFKVPSLRNVALTPPYFHDAGAATLEDAVRVMSRYQLGQPAEDTEIADIVAFLESLTGTWGGEVLN